MLLTGDVRSMRDPAKMTGNVAAAAFAAGRKRAAAGGRTRTVETIVGMVGEAHGLVNAIAARQPANPRIKCKAGCVYCCYHHVECLGAEVFHIARHIQETWSEEARQDLLDRLRHAIRRADGKRRFEYYKKHIRCPLLGKDDRCRIYDRRPFPCRAYTSFSLTRCRKKFEKREDIGIERDRFTKDLNGGVQKGLMVGLFEAGLQSGVYSFNEALLIALEQPDAAERWVSGEDVLAPAKLYEVTGVEDKEGRAVVSFAGPTADEPAARGARDRSGA